jgi:cobalt/nickel transport system ATP-binding protein
LLNVTDLSVVYSGSGDSGAHVLNGVSFRAAPGERIALIGANGAGKSPLLLTLVGVIPIHDGSVTVCGVNLQKKNLPVIRRKAGLLFQNPDDQLFMPTVLEDVTFGPKNYAAETGKTEEEIEDNAEAILEKLEIAHLKDRMSHKLSGGEKRLAALASILVMEPEILLADEPSAFLDPRARRRLISIFKELNQTFIIATHDIELARDLCTRTLLLHKGTIRADSFTDEILNNAALLDECAL